MIIATFNVNSINARLENFKNWLLEKSPDIVLLQEIKTEFNGFPMFDFQTIGYNVVLLGQKSYNGVAILSKHKIKLAVEHIPNFDDNNSRYIEADIIVDDVEYRVASIYLPNGNPPYNKPDDESKFEYKLRWMEALYSRAADLLLLNKPVILGGDYNVILTPEDIYDVDLFKNNALYRKEVRQRFNALIYLGYYDSYKVLHPNDNDYTCWDYAGQAFSLDLGMRIDYLLMNAKAIDALKSCQVDKSPRQASTPSDHTALIAELG